MSARVLSMPGATKNLSAEDAANSFYALLEDHFDDLGLSAEERQACYEQAESRVMHADAELSIAATSE